MLDWSIEAGIHILGVALTAASGLLLVAWGLAGDRHNRLRRLGLGVLMMLVSVNSIQTPLLGIAAVPIAALLLVYWGLFGDRSKGQARCPQCWYDLRGMLPKLTCPECGHDAV